MFEELRRSERQSIWGAPKSILEPLEGANGPFKRAREGSTRGFDFPERKRNNLTEVGPLLTTFVKEPVVSVLRDPVWTWVVS